MDSPLPFKVALVSMPWAIVNRPSVQLATLKSYLQLQQDIQVDNYHPYLSIAASLGPSRYTEIALSGMGGEALFAPLVFSGKKSDSRILFNHLLANSRKKQPDFDEIAATVATACDDWLKTFTCSDYSLIGFSVCFNQLLPSLYMAKLIKQKYPAAAIVFGGSSCSGGLGKSLLAHFPEIDYVISGEGERALEALCSFVKGDSVHLPENVFHSSEEAATKSMSLVDLNQQPPPDYDDYFRQMHHLFTNQPFIPEISLEFSRGCWWNKCSFCNLNIQWPDYRWKNGMKMVQETLDLARRYELLNFNFTDNALPPKDADIFFSEIKKQAMDFSFFAEIRATLFPDRLRLYKEGGLNTVQVGIEALSTSLLEKLKKGTTAIENIAAMKHCCEQNIALKGNLIVEFPSSSDHEVSETLENLDYVLPYPPLDTASFFLGFGSPVHSYFHDYDIRSLTVHCKNRQLFPERYQKSMTMMLLGYRGDRTIQRKRWKPVIQKVRAWNEFHANRMNLTPPLSYRDGKTFLIIRQERPHGPPLQHRLRGLSRRIYLACGEIITLDKLLELFTEVRRDRLTLFIESMCLKRLMFKEQDKVISLAVRQETCR
ncbi:RiPP maturation radical SAM C-methyltransferase [Desulforhopalus singaporensis]|uniref:Ribosomal peptide maturation radical SAM protein 1 n=1 Tax=Desulforhopalus singaporensis TaxID=91360 RepID=A0A1H0TG61_9BACT|nr:RiPP maturation radical SAM C-methyltransferase [Desulforhopalus singaporensis]SDP52964.1 ribosomal peptide maturation radical SAM protein 1 [Desulforhopalus singaporensis]